MRSFKTVVKLFCEDKFLALISLIFFAFINFGEVFGLYSSDNAPLSFLEISMRLSVFCMIFFSLISYEFFYKAKLCNLEECLKSSGKGFQTLYGNQFLFMIILNVIVTITLTIYNVCYYFYLGINHTEYLIHIFENMFIDIFLVSMVGIAIGLCAALMFKRLKAYLLLTLFIILTSPIFEGIAFALANTAKVNSYPITEFFSLYPPSLSADYIAQFGYSVLPYRIELLLFWIFAFLSIALIRILKNSKNVRRLCAGFCIAISLLNFVLYVQPSSKVIMNYDPGESKCCDLFYYWYSAKQKEQPGDFNITKYDLDMKVTNKLSVTASLGIDKGSLNSYRLTLYRGYKISSITDQNHNKLDYTQNGDYIEIKNKNASSISKLILTYSGYSPKFYSNAQGICLPGFFPYYPHSGYLKMYDNDEQGFEKNLLQTSTDFTVKIKSNKKVYSNLNDEGANSFSGKTDGLTLMSGFLNETKASGIEIIYPYLNTQEYGSASAIDKYTKDFLNVKKDNHVVNKIFILPPLGFGNYDDITVYSNYMTVCQLIALPSDYPNLPKLYERHSISENKRPLYDTLNEYKTDREYFNGRAEAESSAGYDFSKNELLLSNKINKFGEQRVIKEINAYLKDNSDTRTIEQFLND